MKRFIYIIAAVLLLSACSNDKDGILSEKKMIKVLRDIHMIDATFSAEGTMGGKYVNLDSTYLYKVAFEKNNVSRDDFIKSLTYYSKYPKKMDHIYNQVINELSWEQMDVNKKAEDAKKTDSTESKGAREMKKVVDR